MISGENISRVECNNDSSENHVLSNVIDLYRKNQSLGFGFIRRCTRDKRAQARGIAQDIAEAGGRTSLAIKNIPYSDQSGLSDIASCGDSNQQIFMRSLTHSCGKYGAILVSSVLGVLYRVQDVVRQGNKIAARYGRQMWLACSAIISCCAERYFAGMHIVSTFR